MGGQSGREIVDTGPVGCADLDQSRTGLVHYVRNPEAAADLYQFAA